MKNSSFNKLGFMKRMMFILFFLCLVISHIALPTSADSTASSWFDSGEFRSSTYYRTLSTWNKTYQKITNEDQEITVSSLIEQNKDILVKDGYFAPEIEEKVTYIIKVNQTGLYYLALDYEYMEVDFSSTPTVDVLVNGTSQYNEMEDLRLNVSWNSSPRDESDRYNRYGDELLPYSVSNNVLYHSYLTDCFNEQMTPYVVLLEEGENKVQIISHKENLLLGSLYIESPKELINYEEYQKSWNISEDSIRIEAENFTSKNDIEVKAAYYKSYTMTPTNYKSQVLNMLDGDSMSRSGTQVSYTFNVENAGAYYLSFKYKQDSVAGCAVGRNIYIDGEIPFAQMQDYLFPYQRKWTNYTLSDADGNPYLFYLTKGQHSITFESTSQHIVDLLDECYSIMDSINSIGLTVNTITGSSSNTQITWKITKYLPTLSEDLISFADRLEEIYQEINDLNPTSKEASEVSTLKVAAKQLRRLAKYPNKIQNRLAELNSGSGSAYQLIGSAIGYLINQSLDIDYFVFHGEDYQMSKPNGNIFGRFFFGLKSFVYSFFDERYNIKLSTDTKTIDVSVYSSSLYTNLIQEMCDDEFTKETGIKVNINILSNTQSIILNNATGTNPDAILELDSWLPYTYALRGILEDLSTYDGFDEITKDIYSSNFTPLIYDTGVYGIPETQGMQLLFYRTDILDSLGLDAPSTWDDVLKMLPTLQSYQMNFYHPLGYDSAYKGFGTTSQFFYMFGSELYTDNGFTTCIGDEKAIEAIQYMTDLFNIYNLPQQVSSFFEHFRSGTLPIGIGGIDLYLQLKYACPELSGQWAVLPIPGMLNSDTGEVERWTTTYGKCSIMFSASEKKDETWEFLKWWHSASTQEEYVLKIKMNLGEKYLIVPANMEALENSPWDKEIKEEVTLAAKWSRIPAITPGSYIIEREISNIWNEVVIDKEVVRVAVNESIPKINRELARKAEEFNYLKNGQIIKEYVVPMNKNINNWVKGKEWYE